MMPYAEISRPSIVRARLSVPVKPLTRETVFLAQPMEDAWRHYPVAKVSSPHVDHIVFRLHVQLGDFGSARLTYPTEDHGRNPGAYLFDAHTEGMMPQEMYIGGATPVTGPPPPYPYQALVMLRLKPEPTRILRKANVWQTARTVSALMRLEDADSVDQLDYYTVPWTNSSGPPKTSSWTPDPNIGHNDRYSTELCDLLRKCLRDLPSQRPSPTQVRDNCAAVIAERYSARRDRLRNRPYREWQSHCLRLGVRKYDRKFAIGQRIRD